MSPVQKGQAWLGFPVWFPQGWSHSRWVSRGEQTVQKGYYEGVYQWWRTVPHVDGLRYVDPGHSIWGYKGLPRSLPNRGRA